MPKTARTASTRQYRSTPIAIAPSTTRNTTSSTFPSIAAAMPSISTTMQAGSMHQRMSHLPPYAGQSMPQMHSYSQTTSPAVQPVQNMGMRPSSGAWTPSDDATLMAARAQAQNWGHIQATYFPNKSSNACRKRHERLMDRRNSDDWDAVKLERMAKEYMNVRKEMWQLVAERTGEKWAVVEAKCMASGLKNLQSASRACHRRERLASTDPNSHHHTNSGDHGTYTDDSGIGLSDLDDGAEAEYGADAYAVQGVSTISQPSYSHHTHSRSLSHQHQTHHTQQQYQPYTYATTGQMHRSQQSLSPETDNGSVGGRGSTSYYAPQGYGMHSQQQRVSSIDMGIGSIINRGV